MSSITLPAVADPDAVIVFTHGLGQSNLLWKSIIQDSLAQRLPSVTWILPQSRDRRVTFSRGQLRPSWFDIAKLPPEETEYDEDAIAESMRTIENLILSQVHAGIDSRRIILVGFSQGAALSLMTALSSLHDLGGVVSLSGWLPHRARPTLTNVGSFPILWLHGESDDEIPLEYAKEAVGFLTECKQIVRLKTYEGLEHTVNPSEIEDLGLWLEATLAK